MVLSKAIILVTETKFPF